MQSTKKKFNLFNTIWDVFTSVRLSVITLVLLALTSIVGTVIPQNQMNAYYKHKYNDIVYQLLSSLNVFDMYHSWWFQFLILILSINILICSMERFPAIWKIIRKKPDFKADRFRRYKAKEEFTVQRSFQDLQEKYKSGFKKKFGKFVLEPADNGFAIFGEKGRWTRLGVYIVHASVLLLLLGSMIGTINGFEGMVSLFEGESSDLISIQKTKRKVKLDFKIRCDKFELSKYKNGATKEYKSYLTILEKNTEVLENDAEILENDTEVLENDTEVLEKAIIVNDPLRYKGINIFQSSYGSIPLGSAVLSFTSQKSGMAYEKKTTIGQETQLPENLGKFILKGFVQSYDFGGHNTGETYLGIIIRPDGKTRNVILPLKYETFDKMFKPAVSVSIKSYDKKNYTVLQVTRDPGVFIVYTGFFFMIIGCYIAFFMAHQSLCIEVTQTADNHCQVMISGTANKNRIGMRMKIIRFASFIKNS